MLAQASAPDHPAYVGGDIVYLVIAIPPQPGQHALAVPSMVVLLDGEHASMMSVVSTVRVNEAHRLRGVGWSLRQIGRALGLSAEGVRKLLLRAPQVEEETPGELPPHDQSGLAPEPEAERLAAPEPEAEHVSAPARVATRIGITGRVLESAPAESELAAQMWDVRNWRRRVW